MPPHIAASRVKHSSNSPSAGGSGQKRPSLLSAGGPGQKRPSLLSAVSSPTKRIARPSSSPPCRAALPASASKTVASAPKKIAPRPTPRPAPSSKIIPKKPARPAPPSNIIPKKPARPAPSSNIIPKKPARPAAAGSSAEAAASRAAESVHPTRRLACGTAVYVRTRYVMITEKCCLLIWLPARIISASDAYHCTIKYAADLHAMFASKVARVPVADVREAPRRPVSSAKQETQKHRDRMTVRSAPAN